MEGWSAADDLLGSWQIGLWNAAFANDNFSIASSSKTHRVGYLKHIPNNVLIHSIHLARSPNSVAASWKREATKKKDIENSENAEEPERWSGMWFNVPIFFLNRYRCWRSSNKFSAWEYFWLYTHNSLRPFSRLDAVPFMTVRISRSGIGVGDVRLLKGRTCAMELKTKFGLEFESKEEKKKTSIYIYFPHRHIAQPPNPEWGEWGAGTYTHSIWFSTFHFRKIL